MKHKITFLAVLLVVLSWSIMVFFFSPTSIVENLGVHTFFAVFIAGVLGGTSILFPFPYYLVVFTAAAGGANALLVGLCAGLGVMIGDSTSYVVGYTGRSVLPQRALGAFTAIERWCKGIHSVKFFAALFTYGAVVPLPNDVIVIPLGAAKVPFWRVIAPFGAGNVTFNTVVAVIASTGTSFF